ncbi:TPA: hypothetical protein IQB31_002951, partial [Listeria monocytogenes]|nr:hypothetical protein [Listeria monocytogenes]
KTRAIDAISILPNLSETVIAKLKEGIANATIINDVRNLQSEAERLSNSNSIEQATTTIDTYKELNSVDKDKFKEELNNAKSQDDVEQIQQVAKALSDARVTANNAIKAAGDLSE